MLKIRKGFGLGWGRGRFLDRRNATEVGTEVQGLNTGFGYHENCNQRLELQLHFRGILETPRRTYCLEEFGLEFVRVESFKNCETSSCSESFKKLQNKFRV